MIKIGVIGFGYWGPNLVRNFVNADGCVVKTVADLNEGRLKVVKKLYPHIEVTASVDAILNDPGIDAVIAAVPVSMHYEIGRRALLKGKHILIEKPMTNSRRDALKLIDLAARKKKVLMVDHTFLYTGAVRKIKELIAAGQVGALQYFDSTRINLGLFQYDINVIWDLACHDVSILMHLFGERPRRVCATGISHTRNGIENIAYITLYFSSKKIAHLHCSWTSPVKIRRILIGGDRKMIVYDDIEPAEKVKIYDSGYEVTRREKERMLVDYRIGDIYAPKIDQTEPLLEMARDFISAITRGTVPVSNAGVGLEVVSILEAAHRSIRQNGKEILLAQR
ncbi:MAG: Gfo/Idh/MocA family oxidoreductase [Candidatus Omnitrophota bacterium]